MNKIAFIIQGNNKIGYGHVFRCLRLADILKKKYNLIFYSYNFAAIDVIKKYKFKCSILYNINSIKHFSCVIIDKLNNNINFLKKISKFNNKLIVIDDINLNNLDNLIKINFLYFPKTFSKKKIIDNLKYYIPFNRIKINKFNKKIRKISIMQGSSDPHRNLRKIYESINNVILVEKKIIFYFHLGIRKKNDKELIYFKSKKKLHKNIHISYNLPNIAKVIKNSDLAITACGISALDLIYSRVPSIYVSNENKELHTAKIFDKLNLGKYYGKISINNQNKLQYCLNNFINNSNVRLKIFKSMKKLNFINTENNFLTLVK